MAGTKGKSGLGKGRTNNPNGRPVGSKNKVQSPVRKRIEEFVQGDFDTLLKEIKALEPKDKVKAKLDLLKLIVPRPLNEEESDAAKTQSEIMRKFFGLNKE